MKTRKEAEELASLMISIGSKMGKKVTALITNMNQPLGSHVGNALEVIEAVQLLQGTCRPEQQDLLELSLNLASHMIVLGKKSSEITKARKLAEETIRDLSAFSKLKEIVHQQGGDSSSLEDFSKLPTASYNRSLVAETEGYLKNLDALSIGNGCVLLGAGRTTLESAIDPAVGVVIRKKIGDQVVKGDTIMEVKYNIEEKLQIAWPYFKNSFDISEQAVSSPPLVKNVLGAGSLRENDRS